MPNQEKPVETEEAEIQSEELGDEALDSVAGGAGYLKIGVQHALLRVPWRIHGRPVHARRGHEDYQAWCRPPA